MTFKCEKLGGICLLISQSLERIAYYSILANFVYTLNSIPLEWTIINAMNATFILSGFCFVATMAGGILSDTILKKSTTVIIGYVFYSAFIGYILIFQNSMPEWQTTTFCSNRTDNNISRTIFAEKCSNIILPITFLNAIGSGLIKSVVASIGADMANKNWKNPYVFYNMYYWSLNCGSLISFGVIAYIQQNVSRFYGFVIPGIALVLSFAFFLTGLPYYINVTKPERSTLILVGSIYFHAIRKKFNSRPKTHNSNSVQDQVDINPFIQNSSSAFSIKKPNYSTWNASIKTDSDSSSFDSTLVFDETVSESFKNKSFLDRSKIRFGGIYKDEEVESVQNFTNLMIIFIYLIPYWILYFQMETTYLNQALHMKLPNIKKKSIPACWLSIMDILVLMFLLPILVKYVYPYLRKIYLYPRRKTRVLIGMILAFISVLIAGAIEMGILKDFESSKIEIQTIGGTDYNYSSINVFFQIPQYIVMGLSESQAVVAGLELACTEVPVSMQAMSNGIFWFISGLGSFIGTGLVRAFQVDHLYNQETKSRIEQYYFLWLAIIQFVGAILYFPYLRYIRKNEKPQNNENITT